MTPRKHRSHIKDRGWSWVVLLAVSVAQLLALGQVLSFGIFFVVLRDEFHCTRQEAALVGSLAFGVKCFAAAPASVAQRKYGCRLVVMTGGLLAALGLLLSYFATRIWHLYLTYGIFVGLGFGCTFVPSVGALPDYFDKYRYFAAALAPVGSAIGTFIFSPFYYYLIEQYTWRGAMVILSGVSLQITVCGAVLKSRTKQKNLTLADLMEKSMFTSGKFILFLCDAFCFGGSTYTVFSMANSLAIKLEMSKAHSTHVVATMGLCNVAGRLMSALISTFPNLNRPLVFAVSTLLCGISALLSTMCGVWWTLAMALGLYGICFGVKVSQLAPVIIEIFGVTRLVNGMGYFMFITGISGVLGPWLAGLLADKTRIESAYWLAGSLSTIASCICFFMAGWDCHHTIKRRKAELEKSKAVPTAESLLAETPIEETKRHEAELHAENSDKANDKLSPRPHSISTEISAKKFTPEPTPRRGWRPALLFHGET